MAKRHRLFDLVVESEIPVYESPPLEGDVAVDVTVTCGSVQNVSEHPATVFNNSRNGLWRCVINRGHVFYKCPAGCYEITDGNRILYQPGEGVREELSRTFLLGSAMAVIQMQRGTYPLHGGVLEVNGKAVLISGSSGAGKSTITSWMVKKGYRYLTDDVGTVLMDGKQPMMLPSYPQRKLRRDACLEMGYNLEDLVLVDFERDKYGIREPSAWYGSRLPFGSVYEIALVRPEDPLRMYEIEGTDKLGVIIRNLFRPWYYEDQKWPPENVKHLIEIANHVKTFRIERPHGLMTVEPILGLLKSALADEK